MSWKRINAKDLPHQKLFGYKKVVSEDGVTMYEHHTENVCIIVDNDVDEVCVWFETFDDALQFGGSDDT